MTNNRLRKLANETDAWCDQNWAGHEFYDVRWEEKFAELIVQECLEQVRFEVQYEYDWSLTDSVTERVLEHFGIE